MEFALIRHTRCEVAEGTCYGHLDVPLAPTAAADIASTLSRIPRVDLVFSSPSRRCHSLARAIAARDTCEVRTRDELRELNFGAWEGLRWNEIPRSQSDTWSADPWNEAPPEGESESRLWQRVARVAAELLQLEGPARIAVVSHGGPLRHLRCLLTDRPASERWSWSSQCGEVSLLSPRAARVTGCSALIGN